MNSKITFNDIPLAISELISKVDNLEKILLTQITSKKEQNKWFSIDELCEYLPGKPTKAYIYTKVHRREIPHKKVGKRLVFLKSDIDEWLNAQNRKTISEIIEETEHKQIKK